MRAFLGFAVLALCATPAVAQVHVRGYVRSDGTYVAPSVRSAPNSSRYDNWSSAPNVNPYNGRQGTVDPYQPTMPRMNTTPTYQPPRTSGYQPYTPPCYYNCRR